MAQVEYFGIGTISNLTQILSQHNPQNIFLVTGKQSYQSSGAQTFLQPILAPYQITRFSDFQLNPKIEDIEKGIALFRQQQCDLVLAVGGGSVIDTAKTINILTPQLQPSPEKYVKGELKIEQPGKPLIAIPTTSGTGSEATHFAVVYIGKKKYSLAHQFILPNYAIIDPQLTFNLPKKITAETGMDALGQAIEAYWSINSTEESKFYSSQAITIILNNLGSAVNHPTPESRTSMAKASNLAGKAINISFTTACHAISYPITSYFNVPHGHAVALTLAGMFLYNSQATAADCQDSRGIQYVQKTMTELTTLLQSATSQQAAQKITQLMQNIGLETRLFFLGISSQEQLNLIVEHGFNPERVKNNPREIDQRSLQQLLQEIQ